MGSYRFQTGLVGRVAGVVGMLIPAIAAAIGGCAPDLATPRVLFLDGAGWYGSDRSVRRGLGDAGFVGTVERFRWSSGLGALPDHVAVGPDHPKVAALAKRITKLRRADPDGQIVMMGLSAGTGIVILALEKLPPDVAVDHVVLLSPSISSRHDLRPALAHITGRLYTTTSRHDGILAVAGSAGLAADRPAGRVGFQPPPNLDSAGQRAYRKVVTLDWRPGYVAYGWDGRHVSVTSSEFVRVVIAPRIMDKLPHPLDATTAVPRYGIEP